MSATSHSSRICRARRLLGGVFVALLAAAATTGCVDGDQSTYGKARDRAIDVTDDVASQQDDAARVAEEGLDGLGRSPVGSRGN